MRTVLIALTALGFFVAPSVAASSIGAVTLVHFDAYGTVEGGKKERLFIHDEVYQNEIVETVTDGALHLEFSDKTIFRLGSASRMTLDTLVYNPNDNKNDQMVISMVQGVFRFISGTINKRGIRLLTPTLGIGIRGTDFTIAISPDGSTSVSVAEGEIEITPIVGGDPVIVTTGQVATLAITSKDISISTGNPVSADPGLSEAGPESGGRGGHGGDGGGGH